MTAALPIRPEADARAIDAAVDAPAPLAVCLVVESAGGGTGRHVLDLAQGLIAGGDAVTLIHCPLRAEPAFLARAAAMPGLRVHALPMGRAPGPRDLLAVLRLSRLTARLGPFDVIHSHSTKAGILARLIPARGARLLHTPHAARGMDPTLPRAMAAMFDLAERLLSRRCDRVIAVSASEAQHLRAAGLPPRKLLTIVNGVAGMAGPADRPQAEPHVPQLLPAIGPPHRQDAGPRHDPPAPHVFGFVGRIVPQKGADRLIRAFAGLPRHPPALLVVIGDGPDLPALCALARQLGVAPRIAFPGAGDAAPWYPRFDTLILPSRYEAMPYVLLEAEAAGLPILATDVAGAAEVVVENGRIVPNRDDPGPLTGAMAACLDPDTHARFRAAAAVRRDSHGLQAMTEATRAAYADSAPPLALYTPKPSAVHRMHLDALTQHAGEAGLKLRPVGLRDIAGLRRNQRLFVQATGLANLVALPLARLRGVRVVLYLHEPTPLARKLAENPPLKALVWHLVQRIECRLAQRIMVSRPDLTEDAARIFADRRRIVVAPLLMAAPDRTPLQKRDRILYLGRPDARRCLAEFAALAPSLTARGYRPTILTGDPAGLDRLLPRAGPGDVIEIIARRDFSEALKARILSETLCLWNPKRGPIAQSGVTADALRHGVAILLTDRDPAHGALVAAGIALDWDAEAARGFSGLDRIDPEAVAATARRLFDDWHGAGAFRLAWLPWLR